MEYSYLPQSQGADAHLRCPYCNMPHAPTPPPKPQNVPRVRARHALSPAEIADGRGQAMSTGQLAVEHGWNVEPLHYVDDQGVQKSVLRMRHKARGRVLFVEWKRPDPRGPWVAEQAFTFKPGVPDSAKVCSVTNARKLLAEEPEWLSSN